MKSAIYVGVSAFILSSTGLPLFAQWQQRGIPNQNVHALLTDDTFTYAGSDSGCYLSTDDGVSWMRRSNGLPSSLSAFPKTFALQGSNLYAGTNGGGGVYLTTDNGVSWNVRNAGLGSTAVHALIFNNNSLIAGTLNGGVFESTDNGTSWHELNNSLTSLAVHALLVIPGRLFAGTGGGVFISTNSGASWSLPSGSPLEVRSLVSRGPDLFAATRFDGIFKSTDNGSTWTVDTVGMTSLDVRVILEYNGNLFAGTGSSGVYLSTNGGERWTQINTGLAGLSILSLATNGTTLYAGAQSGGVWTRPLSQVVAVGEHRSPLPITFVLEQNYPNPFNPSTTIRYHIPAQSYVSLKVFDVLGEEVETLVGQVKEAGDYSITWNASRRSSGLYFYRLMSEGHSEVKSMLLLK